MADDEFNLERMLIKHPEDAFVSPTLIHTSTEIDSIISAFNQSIERPSHQFVIDVLNATRNFRLDTEVEGVFARKEGDLSGLDAVFKELEQALLHAEKAVADLDAENQQILTDAIAYCKTAILDRVSVRTKDQAFIQYWDKSDLNRLVNLS